MKRRNVCKSFLFLLAVLSMVAVTVTFLGTSRSWAQSESYGAGDRTAARNALTSPDFSGIEEAPTQITNVQLIEPLKGRLAYRLTYLKNRVERGEAPDRVIGARAGRSSGAAISPRREHCR